MKKVLIVTYYWPPAGGPGVQRWLNFVRFLPEFEVAPTVYIPKNPHYPLTDESLVDKVPENVTILKQPIWEPYGLAKLFSGKKTKRISSGIIANKEKQSVLERLMLWIRGNLFVPDARKFWVKPSVLYLESYLKEHKIDTLITTGPPHSLHLIGLKLKNKLQINWIADFRDPWTSIGYHSKLKLSKSTRKKHKQLELQVLNQADTVIVTSKHTQLEFSKLTNKPIKVITNGYLPNTANCQVDQTFTLSHIGSLLTDRNPKLLWEVLRELSTELSDFKAHLKIKLVGTTGKAIIDSLKSNGLENNLELIPYVAHDSVLMHQKSAQVLLLLEIDSDRTTGIIPGKLFEYFNAKRPILAIGPNNWEAGNMVVDHRVGSYAPANEKEQIKNAVLAFYSDFKNGNLSVEAEGIQKYQRSYLAKDLAKVIHGNRN